MKSETRPTCTSFLRTRMSGRICYVVLRAIGRSRRVSWASRTESTRKTTLAMFRGSTSTTLRMAIVALNSSWLAEGGAGDEGKLIIGEGQVRSAMDRAKGWEAQVVLSLQHHPFESLQRFDGRPVQRRLEETCDFVHCGHLHDPELTEVVVDQGRCLTIKAGASFESRGSRNAVHNCRVRSGRRARLRWRLSSTILRPVRTSTSQRRRWNTS